ncbi:molybdopterin molybdotransferase MoeA [Rhizobiales bacterium]|uniref:molybdopterin molybdotransferase MoeA n=1 Tax=Hongsoonwoonella zoysiae TaxID=2821844 RepID=UPI0015607AD3|nr:gephyrin-like molybdotransferase Glp [Hongsoonwoonella zoysiae]NRG18343.1 molybdopterin molybdotransferase MoeA [Hongsoonwoonella zoysiae]
MQPSKRLLNDCFLHDKDRLKHADALAILKERVSRIVTEETVPLEAAHGRILAEEIHAPRNIPAHDNAAVDGYAFASRDFEAAGGFFPVVERVAAGHPAPDPVPAGGAVRIFTGAVMPEGVDTIAMQEDCEPHEQDGLSFVVIPPGLKLGANRRKAGEDVKEGSLILQAGTKLRPQDIAAIASTGQAEVKVWGRVKVALVSTGDEIRRPGEPLPEGGVYDSNHFLLRSLLETVGATVTDCGVLPDKAEIVHETLTKTAQSHDAIITTGGASRGEEDHLVTALDTLGKRHVWQLAIKPGRPMNFGQIGDCVMLGLPGNPVAAMVCFLLYARPVLTVMGGGEFTEPRRFQIPADFEIAKKKPDRREFYRGILATDANGLTVARKFEHDGSGLITGLREADGLIEIREETTGIRKGELVNFIPFTETGLFGR